MKDKLLLHEQANHYQLLDDWFNTPQGLKIAEAFSTELRAISHQLYGTSLLQLGFCGGNTWLSLLNFTHKWIVDPRLRELNAAQASLTAMPFDKNTIDCIIAPLTLEMFPKQQNPLQEIDRILKPMGYVIFFGINPISLWRMEKYKIFSSSRDRLTLTSSFTLKRLMLARNYQQCIHTSFYYLPSLKNVKLIEKLEFLNEMGKMIWPFPAGFYCLVLQKYTHIPPKEILTEPHPIMAAKPSI